MRKKTVSNTTLNKWRPSMERGFSLWTVERTNTQNLPFLGVFHFQLVTIRSTCFNGIEREQHSNCQVITLFGVTLRPRRPVGPVCPVKLCNGRSTVTPRVSAVTRVCSTGESLALVGTRVCPGSVLWVLIHSTKRVKRLSRRHQNVPLPIHVNHLEGKALGLQNLARGGKFWRDEEDIKAGLTMWEVVCKPVLNYGAEVWACSSKTDEQRLERIQNRAGRRILGLSWRFHGVVVRGELGWRKLKYDRHSSALKFAGRLRGMGWERWPKIVGEALSRLQNNGTWVDYIRSLIARYKLQTCWEDDRWNEKVWKKVVVEQVEREGKRAWREEVEGKQDLGSYKDRQLVLERADYIANSSGDKIRAEIKGKCEWGEHFQIWLGDKGSFRIG